MEHAAKERAGGEDHGGCAVDEAAAAAHARRTAGGPAVHQQRLDGLLAQGQARLCLQAALHLEAIGGLIGLGAGGVHRGAFARVEHAELDAGGVGQPCHLAAERINLAHELPLCQPADGRVATHVGDSVEVHRQERGAGAHARRRQGSLAACMPCAHNDDVERQVFHGHF